MFYIFLHKGEKVLTFFIYLMHLNMPFNPTKEGLTLLGHRLSAKTSFRIRKLTVSVNFSWVITLVS